MGSRRFDPKSAVGAASHLHHVRGAFGWHSRLAQHAWWAEAGELCGMVDEYSPCQPIIMNFSSRPKCDLQHTTPLCPSLCLQANVLQPWRP